MSRIAACLIVKDSASTIEKALDSIRPHVDGIFVYDTGSTDDTVEKMEDMARVTAYLFNRETNQKVGRVVAGEWIDDDTGDVVSPDVMSAEGWVEWPLADIVVERGEWRGDFSWAREQSFAMPDESFDWLFWMDDDDIVIGAQNLRALAATAHAHVDGYLVYYDYARDEFGNNICQLWRERLVRRSSDGAWINAVHEVWLPHGEGGSVRYVAVPREQLAFVHDRPADRYAPDRNLQILLEREEEFAEKGEPLDLRTVAYIGTELMAHARMPEAIPYLERYLSDPRSQVGDERSQVAHKLAICLRELGQPDAAVHAEMQAIIERDDWAENYAGLAEAFAAKGDWTRVKTWAKRALELGMPQSMLILNPLELVYLPTVRMAQACGALGQYDEAKAWVAKASELRPQDPFLLQVGQGIDSTATTQKIVDAVLLLREVLVRHDENWKAYELLRNAVPYIVAEHPLITSAKSMQTEMVMHALEPAEYLRWYEDEPKESTVTDEMVPVLGQGIERAGFTLEMARKFEAEHGRKPRMLDLGCNDAWMACYLWVEGGFHVDGVELNKASVEKGLKRVERFGAPGRIVQGDIHNAQALLSVKGSVETYDIVTCYEVYEHVPDTDRLLAVMESLLTPEGMACVTTPAGAYERGALDFWNVVERKGHLRAVTPAELAGQIMGRGQLLEQRVHHADGRLQWVAWRPKTKKGRVHLFAGGAWEQWSPRSIREGGVGGSETALTQLACGLGEMGWDVRVFTDATPGVYMQSLWRPAAAFDPTEKADAIIVSRQPGAFNVDLHAPTRVLWCHDHTYEITPEQLGRMTDIAVLSDWQKRRFERLIPASAEKLRVLRNGVLTYGYGENDERFPDATNGFNERKPVCIYSSSADRGLDVMLEVWPRIRKQVPDAELHVYYGWDVFDRVAISNPALMAYKQHVMALAEIAGGEDGGVFFKGRVGQPELYAAMQEARVWTYPTAFLETSCIGAMEARCAGLPIVTSELGALAETAERGWLIPWEVAEDEPLNRTDEYQDEFVDRVTMLLSAKEAWEVAHTRVSTNSHLLDWRHRVAEWDALIEAGRRS